MNRLIAVEVRTCQVERWMTGAIRDGDMVLEEHSGDCDRRSCQTVVFIAWADHPSCFLRVYYLFKQYEAVCFAIAQKSPFFERWNSEELTKRWKWIKIFYNPALCRKDERGEVRILVIVR